MPIHTKTVPAQLEQSGKPSPFSSEIPNLQILWDSTSLGFLKRCPRFYQLRMLEGLETKMGSIHLTFGIIYHKALEIYDQAKAHNHSHKDAQRQAVDHALDASVEHFSIKVCPNCQHQADAEAETCPACQDDLPEETSTGWRDLLTEIPQKGRLPLTRAIVWYTETFKNDRMETITLANGDAAVELSFTLPLDFTPAGSGESYALRGHIDRVAKDIDGLWIPDRKAQPWYARVFTPAGWKEVGNLLVGDEVATADGSFTVITGLYPKGTVPVKSLTFSDKTTVHCAVDHLWTVGQHYMDNWKLLTMEEVMEKHDNYIPLHVPQPVAVSLPEQRLPIHPWLLGALIGDGYLGSTSAVSLSTSKTSIEEKARDCLPISDELVKNSLYNYSWSIRKKIKDRTPCDTLQGIRSLGLSGTSSHNKFIPQIYLHSSIQQRRKLLEGLFETDGTQDESRTYYDTMSPYLAEDFCTLVRSLGGYAHYRRKSDGGYRIVFYLQDEGNKPPRKTIKKIEDANDAECICIEVEDKSGLYVTDGFTLTHNTTKGTLYSSYFDKFSPDNQVTLYTLAGRIVLHQPIQGVVIDAAQMAVNFSRFQRGYIHRTVDQLEEWMADLQVWLNAAEQYAKQDRWPQNELACDLYGGCPFRNICGRSPAIREKYIEQDFVRQPWNPAEDR